MTRDRWSWLLPFLVAMVAAITAWQCVRPIVVQPAPPATATSTPTMLVPKSGRQMTPHLTADDAQDVGIGDPVLQRQLLQRRFLGIASSDFTNGAFSQLRHRMTPAPMIALWLWGRGLPPALEHVCSVLARRPYLEVRRPDTPPNIAQVLNLMPIGDGANIQGPRQTVRPLSVVMVDSNGAIATRGQPARPEPAFTQMRGIYRDRAVLVNESPEASGQINPVTCRPTLQVAIQVPVRLDICRRTEQRFPAHRAGTLNRHRDLLIRARGVRPGAATTAHGPLAFNCTSYQIGGAT